MNASKALIRMNGRILFASTQFCKLVGVSHSKVSGMSYFDFVFPEDLDAARRLFQTNKHLKSEPFSFRLKRIDGEPVWVEIQVAAQKRNTLVSVTVTAKAQVA